MIKGAIIDETQKYRYLLWRIWDETKPKIVFLMLNGSTADAETNDNTLNKCISYAKSWGFGKLEIVNLFSYRTALPAVLKKAPDPIGPLNEKYILESLKGANMVVVAWGAHGNYKNQNKVVLKLLKSQNVTPFSLGYTKDGNPKHPLYLKADIKPEVFVCPKV